MALMHQAEFIGLQSQMNNCWWSPLDASIADAVLDRSVLLRATRTSAPFASKSFLGVYCTAKGKFVRFSVIKNGDWFTVLVGCRRRLWTQFCVAIGIVRVYCSDSRKRPCYPYRGCLEESMHANASSFSIGLGNLGQTSDKNDNTVVRIAIIWALAACQSSLSQLSVRYTVGRAGINGG